MASHEGLVVAPYKDVVGVWTYGVGHTSGAGSPDPSTMPMAMPMTSAAMADEVARAIKLFAEDLEKYEKRVRDAVKVSLSQHEFDALVSFDFNTGGIFKANLTKKLNAGDRAGAARGFMGWLRPEAIRGRRTAEMRLFQSGDYPNHSTPIYGTNGRGKLGGIIDSIQPDELLSVFGEARPQPAPAPVPQEAPTAIPAEVLALINESSGEKSKTDFLNQVLQWATGGGLMAALPNIKAILESVDPMVITALIIAAVAVFGIATYTRSSRKRKDSKSRDAMMALRASGLI